MSHSLALFLVFFACLFAGVPVALSLAVASLYYLFVADIGLAMMANQFFAGMNSFVLLCIPGFLLAGALMNGGGITARIVGFSNAWLGHIRGGLAMANVTGSMIFAGISGTAVSEAASIGSVMIPAMKRTGYDAPFSGALTAVASTVGPIIPPSVPMIIVGTLTGLSVSKLFLAGAVPGVLMGLGMGLTAYVLARRRGYPKGPKASWRARFSALRGAIWAILMPLLIIGGLVGGTFTPTEASVVAVVFAMLVGFFVYKDLTLAKFLECVHESATGTAGILLLVGFANVFGWILTSEGIPQMIADALLSISRDKYTVLFLLNVLLLIVGMFMETIAALLILFPPLATVAAQVGVDPIHFAVIMVMNLVIGLTTPPVGVCLFVAQSIARISLAHITRAVMPFLLVNIGVLFLVSYAPPLALWLPNALGLK
ncbi:MAG TPA: TRAP transporter large permease [Candidatus Competibacteraceae bacterium]|nr:TRAP transporter large permease [Candidatus Competibacteraceae bacterium]